MASRADIIRVARSWINTPFKHQGRTRRGVDCVGLVSCVARELGLSSYDSTHYSRRPSEDPSVFLSHFRDNCEEILPWPKASLGDILVFSHQSLPCHVGILSETRREASVIHSVAAYRCVRETTLDEFWRPAVKFAFRFPNVKD